MKKLIVVLFLILSLNIKAEIPESAKVIGICVTHITLNAIGDGLNDDNKILAGHLCDAGSIGVLLMSPYIIDIKKDKWYYYLITYTSLRIALFDPIYNKTRGLPIEYVGTYSITDKIIHEAKLNKQSNLSFRSGFLVIGIYLPLDKFK